MKTALRTIVSPKNMNLPERISVDRLEEAGDILLSEGVKILHGIMMNPESQDTAVKAFNAAVGMQRYITVRRKFESDIEGGLPEDDLGDILG